MSIKPKIIRKNKQSVKLAHDASSKLRHFRLVHRRHTGTVVHHRHTSHLALFCLLAVVGLFVLAFHQVAQALPPPVSRNVQLNAIVPGPPPAEGAVITSPTDGAELPYETTIEVSGTCVVDTMVVVSSNNNVVGSVACTSAGIFVLDVQLNPGTNVLTAKNYDTLNQPGPDTPEVTVTLILPTAEQPPGEQNLAVQPIALPLQLSENPYSVPSVNKVPKLCDDYDVPSLPTGGPPRIAVVCLPRSVEPDVEQMMGVLVWGGTPPYALDIDWGDGSTERGLISLAVPGYAKIPFKYKLAGSFKVSIKLKDKNGAAGFVQSGVVVHGETKSIVAGINDAFNNIPWFEVPVPLYFLAVALTIGFWAGDLFDRRFGVTKHYRKTRRSA